MMKRRKRKGRDEKRCVSGGVRPEEEVDIAWLGTQAWIISGFYNKPSSTENTTPTCEGDIEYIHNISVLEIGEKKTMKCR